MPGSFPDPSAADRVLLGAHLLSARQPGWWRPEHIDPARIDMTYTAGPSILTLTHGTYHMGLVALDLLPEDAPGYGFAATSDEDAVALRDAWFIWITRRRAESQSPQHATEGKP
jgi:hypothetical protein